MVRATLKGQLFFHNNPNEATKFMMEVLRLSDFDQAREVWSDRTKQSSDLAKIGRAREETMTVNIERVRDQMRMVGAGPKVKGPISLDQVYDFSFAKRAYDELKAKKWDPLRYEYSKR